MQVNYTADLALQGGTPAYMLPLLAFNHLTNAWGASQPCITVQMVHSHVLNLHSQLLAALPRQGQRGLTLQTLFKPSPEAVRSHTLVFQQPSTADAKAVVEELGRSGVVVDCRKEFVRVGCGPNHSAGDMAVLVEALKKG